MKKMKVKTFAYGGLGCLLISLVSFFILTKPFLYYGATQYTNITIPLNTVLVIALCFGFGLFLAHKQKTVEQIPYGMTRGAVYLDEVWVCAGDCTGCLGNLYLLSQDLFLSFRLACSLYW